MCPGRGSLFSLIVGCCLLFAACCLFSACGQKSAPTLKAYEKPQPPSHVTAVCRPTEIILTWDFPREKQSTIKGFFVMRSAGGDFEKIAFVENKNRTYKDSHFNSATSYTYKIIAQNLRGILGHDSPVVDVKPKALPAPPADLSFSIAYNTLTLSWKGPEEGISYNIYKSSVKGNYPDTPLNGKPVQGRSFRDSFDMNKPVHYTVRSITGDGVKYEGPASAELSVDPREFVPSRPGDLRATATADSVSLVWNEPAETWITGYRVYRETNKKQGFVLLGETQVPTFTDKGKPSSKRSYRVTAVGPVKEGPAAEVRNIIYMKPRKPR